MSESSVSVNVRPTPVSVGGVLQDDDVRNWLLAWSLTGHRCALATIIAVDGGVPRSVGAQMVVSANGQYAGYLSGGCLEQAVALEALDAIRRGSNRRVRYGAGSPYIDIRLPCGSSIDVYIDQCLDLPLIRQLVELRDARSACALQTDLRSGRNTIIAYPDAHSLSASWLEGDLFTRAYVPPLKLQLMGAGPSLVAIARVAASAGFLVGVASPSDDTRQSLQAMGVQSEAINGPRLPSSFRPDRWTAVVLAFHDHVWEPPIIMELLGTPSYYIGAIGSRTVHKDRLRSLADNGVNMKELSRIRGPIGLVPGAKSSASLAFGVIAEILAEAKSRGFVA